MLRTCLTKGCETKTLGGFCVECEFARAEAVAEPLEPLQLAAGDTGPRLLGSIGGWRCYVLADSGD
jgi:hypothetical protein